MARNGHSLCWVAHLNSVMVYGGLEDSISTKNILVYSVYNNRTDMVAPIPRTLSITRPASIANSNALYIFDTYAEA
jgi:hypothetical protein